MIGAYGKKVTLKMTSLSDMTTATNMMSKKNYLSRPLMLKYPNLSLNMIKAERDIFENDVVTAPFEY